MFFLFSFSVIKRDDTSSLPSFEREVRICSVRAEQKYPPSLLPVRLSKLKIAIDFFIPHWKSISVAVVTSTIVDQNQNPAPNIVNNKPVKLK